MKQIICTVEATGSVRIDAVGFKGGACKKATEALERALGRKSGVQNKPEFHQTQAASAKQGAA